MITRDLLSSPNPPCVREGGLTLRERSFRAQRRSPVRERAAVTGLSAITRNFTARTRWQRSRTKRSGSPHHNPPRLNSAASPPRKAPSYSRKPPLRPRAASVRPPGSDTLSAGTQLRARPRALTRCSAAWRPQVGPGGLRWVRTCRKRSEYTRRGCGRFLHLLPNSSAPLYNRKLHHLLPVHLPTCYTSRVIQTGTLKNINE